jgi:hypothetical protein
MRRQVEHVTWRRGDSGSEPPNGNKLNYIQNINVILCTFFCEFLRIYLSILMAGSVLAVAHGEQGLMA